MTTETQAGVSFEVRAIASDVVGQLLAIDDAGNPPRLLTDDEGGSPLRCCLRPAEPGELIALVSYAPLRRWARETGARPGPYDEVGPVFVHARFCPGPDGTGYPRWLAAGRRVLRAYNADGLILGGRLIDPDPARSPVPAESALAELFADPEVALVHARALEFGCFTFEVRRAPSEASRRRPAGGGQPAEACRLRPGEAADGARATSSAKVPCCASGRAAQHGTSFGIPDVGLPNVSVT